jgi:hypothetical protein
VTQGVGPEFKPQYCKKKKKLMHNKREGHQIEEAAYRMGEKSLPAIDIFYRFYNLNFFIIISFIHMCIQCLGHFSPVTP